MTQIIRSLQLNAQLWSWHVLLWATRLVLITLAFMGLQSSLNSIVSNRYVAPYLWQQTDISFLMDWLRELSPGILSGVATAILLLMLLWFVIDTLFDLMIINRMGQWHNHGKRDFWRLIALRAIFLVIWLIAAAGAVYAWFSLWWGDFTTLVFYGIAFIFIFLLLWVLKFMDLAKIIILRDNELGIGSALSTAINKAFADFASTALLHFLVALAFSAIFWLSTAITIDVVATSASMLWLIWLGRELLLFSRQFLRYTYTGVWLNA
jgi:hypothetical protein